MNLHARVGVLISGRGSNLQALIEACARFDYPAQIACVISNVADAEGLRHAARAGIPSHAVAHGPFATRETFDSAMDAILREADVGFVCLAGFMRVLSDGFVENWRGRLINVHPSLLPAFKGLAVHRRVLELGARISGCTVHFVVRELDFGPDHRTGCGAGSAGRFRRVARRPNARRRTQTVSTSTEAPR